MQELNIIHPGSGLPMKSERREEEERRKATQPRRRTMSEMVNELMCNTQYGELGRAFVVAGLEHYARTVSEGPRPESSGNGLVDAQLWYDIAKDVKGKIDLMQKQNAENVIDASFEEHKS